MQRPNSSCRLWSLCSHVLEFICLCVCLWAAAPSVSSYFLRTGPQWFPEDEIFSMGKHRAADLSWTTVLMHAVSQPHSVYFPANHMFYFAGDPDLNFYFLCVMIIISTFKTVENNRADWPYTANTKKDGKDGKSTIISRRDSHSISLLLSCQLAVL